MKAIICLTAASFLCSCYPTNFAKTSQTARISGKMEKSRGFLQPDESHAFLSAIDGRSVRGTRTMKVDAGKRVIEAGFSLATNSPEATGASRTLVPGTFIGGMAVLTPVLEAGHTYKVEGGSSIHSRTAFVYDITGGRRDIVASAPMVPK